MSLDMHIWSCIRANSKYKVATTLHRKRRSSPRLPLPLGSCLGHPHHLVVVVKGKWWFTRLSGGYFAFVEHVKSKIQLKVNEKCVFLLGVLKITFLENCYLYLTADAKNVKIPQKHWFSREKVLANRLLIFLENYYLHLMGAEKYQKIL